MKKIILILSIAFFLFGCADSTNEKEGKVFESRFSSKITLADTKALFDSNQWVITTKYAKGTTMFSPSKKTEKAIDVLRNTVFVLM